MAVYLVSGSDIRCRDNSGFLLAGCPFPELHIEHSLGWYGDRRILSYLSGLDRPGRLAGQKDAYERAQQNGAEQDGQAKNNIAAPIPKIDPIAKGYAEPELLTSAALLKGNQVILDVRTLQDYQSGHISGARSLYWKDLQKDGILDPALAKEALCRAGVNDSDRLLVYGDSDEGAAFVFWALSYLGHKNVSMLDGGADEAWNAGLQKDKCFVFHLPSNYTIHIVPWLLVTPDNLDLFLALADVQILDARDFSDYGQSRLTNESISFKRISSIVTPK